MWLGKASFQKVEDAERDVRDSTKPHSPPVLFFFLLFWLGKRRRG